ncbi:MAG: ParB family chromosome partitioning protein [Psychroserpens sp.]|jgi:ParB family chromosome partitioning protein
MTEISNISEYQKKVEEINIEDLKPSAFNPRARFNEGEEEELIDSILSKGILNPILVYLDRASGKYIILDGERRYRACKKINIKKVPARILLKEPGLLESLSLMFHIHNVREDWTEFAISITIRKIVEEMGKQIQDLNSYDLNELTRMTSLSKYRINKYLKFQDYPNSVIEKFLHYEVYGSDSENQPDPDILLEMHKPIKDMQEIMPGFFNLYSIDDMIDSCIEKKMTGIIKTNKEFRLISKSLTAVKKNELPVDLVKRNLDRFFSDTSFAPNDLYQRTSQSLYQFKNVMKTSKSLFDMLSNFKMDNIEEANRRELENELERLLDQIRSVR